MYYIFLETSDKNQFNDDDSRHHANHQEDQDDQKCPPTSRRFLIGFLREKIQCIIYFWKPQMKNSSMIMNPDIMTTTRKISMSYKEVLDGLFEKKRPYLLYIFRNLR